MEIISKVEAKAQGLKRFFTGVPCNRGHICERLVSNNGCVMCIKERRPDGDSKRRQKLNLYARDYRKNNSDTLRKQAQLRYSTRKSTRVKLTEPEKADRRRRYYISNKDRILSRARERHQENREVNLKRQKEYRLDNADKINQSRANKYRADPAIQARVAMRRALKKKATPSWFSELDSFAITEAIDLSKRRALATGIEWHVDHIIPLSSGIVCGLHCADNIRVIPGSINASKSNRLILSGRHEWLSML